jgi:DNA-binding MarR family transcriptional regulator
VEEKFTAGRNRLSARWPHAPVAFAMQIGITYSRPAYSLLIKYTKSRSDKSENLISLANKQDEKGSGMELLDVVGLLRAVQVLERNLSVALMYSGLRIPQFRLLNVLSQAGQATVTEVSEKLHVTRATASVMVNELIRSGALDVVENPADRRSFHIRITDAGMQKLNVARSDVGVFIDKVSRRYSPAAIKILNEFAGMTV